jgi:hypothetical protein
LVLPTKAAAAAKARDIYLFLTVNGWALTLAKHKPKSRSAPASSATKITVGSFLDAVFAISTNRSTIEGYATAFRKIVADLFGFASDPAKYDHQSGGRAGWLAKVHAIELSKITPANPTEVVSWSLSPFRRESTVRLRRLNV